MSHVTLRSGLRALAGLAAAAAAAPLAAAEPAACEALAHSLTLPRAKITLAQSVPAGGLQLPQRPGGMGPPLDVSGLPAMCRVAGTLRPSPDSDIRFEVWLPLQGWNGKFVGGGNGVWAGSIAYGDMVGPLQRGYATAASDMGHQGSPLDAGFLVGHPEKLTDFGHRAIHETAVAAKAIIAAYYGTPARRSLYASCSTGGRLGLMLAYRYPQDYDGISAMAPANPMVPLMVMSLWTGAATMTGPGTAIPPATLARVHQAALAACDARDAVSDGIISDPPACGFDPASLQCSATGSADCLSPAQVAALRRIYAGPVNPRTGKRIYPGLAVGSEMQMPALTSGKEPFPVATTFFRGPVFNDPAWDFRRFDYDHDVQRALAYASDALDVPPDRLDRFFAQRRKLLLSHGWADGLIPAQSTIDFHAALVRDIGPRRAREGVRLFMAPGMAHCAGGSGPSVVDMLGALDAWVESGKPPERILASNPPGAPPRTRPLCPWPQVARYAGSGSTDEESNFRCSAP